MVAHPDDVEYGTSSAVAAWTARGIDVAYLLITCGEAGMDSLPPAETAELRVREQVAGSHAVGVSQVDFLKYPDGVLAYSMERRRDIARRIRSYRPDAVLVGSWEVDPELLDEGLEPWSPRMMITGTTAMSGRRMGVPNAVLFRAFDFHAPPPIALEAMQLAATAADQEGAGG